MHPVGHPVMAGNVVSQQHDDIGVETVRRLHDLANPADPNPRLARMQVRQRGDAQAQTDRPGPGHHAIARHLQTHMGLEAEGVAGQADACEQARQAPFEEGAPRYHAMTPWLAAPTSTMTTSGGTPMRTGRIEQPSPPETTRCRLFSTICPYA